MITSTDAFDYPAMDCPPSIATLRAIIESPRFHDAIATNARIVVIENTQYAKRTHQPLPWLVNDITTHIWEKRWGYDPKWTVQTWAKKAAHRRLIDLVRAAETQKAKKLSFHEETPERPQPTKSKLSGAEKPDFESRMAALAYIAKCRAAAMIPPRRRQGPRPFTDSQLAAILVLRMDRGDTLRGILLRLAYSSSLRDELRIENGSLPSRWALMRASLRWWGRDYAIAYLLHESLRLMGAMEKEIEP